jgi:hypothetical protein
MLGPDGAVKQRDTRLDLSSALRNAERFIAA